MRSRTVALGALALVLVASAIPVALADNPPEVAFTFPDSGATVSGVITVTGRARDDVGVAGVKVRIDAGDWRHAQDTSHDGSWSTWALEWDTTKVPNGVHRIAALAWDTSNQYSDASIEVIVENPTDGNHPPWVAIDEPPNHSTVRGIVTVMGRAGDEDDNDTVEIVQVRIDDGDWQNATPTGDNGSFRHWAFDWNTTLVDDGWHAFSARAFDGEAWSGSKVFEYLVDNLQDENRAPSVRILHPQHEESVSGTVLIHGRASDPDDGDRVDLVEVRFRDDEWRAAVDTSHDDSWSTWAFQWDTTNEDNGAIRVCARSFDGDLYSEPSCITVKVANEHDDRRPTVKIAHPANNQKVEGLVLIHGSAADDVGVKLVEIRFGDAEWREAVDTSPDDSWTTWAYEWDTTKHDDGCGKISARSWDGGLFSEVHTISVCWDNHDNRPWVKIRSPQNGETVEGLVLVHGTAGDDHGVKLVQVRIDEGEWHHATNTGRERPWTTWAFEWDTTAYDNGKHRVCARSYDGKQYSELSCVVVYVDNQNILDAGLFSQMAAPLGRGAPLVALGLVLALGVAILMWLRSHGYIQK